MATHKVAAPYRKPLNQYSGSGHRPKLAIVGTGGLAYLRGRICAASIRGGFDADIFCVPSGTDSEILDLPSYELSQFNPNVVLIVVNGACLPLGRGISRSCVPWARQDLAATMLQQTVLPMLHPSYEMNVHHLSGLLPSLLQTADREMRVDAQLDEIQFALSSHGRCGEVIIACHIAPIWLRRGRGSTAGGLSTTLFGGRLTCLVVDTGRHPWITQAHRDLSGFLSRWSRDKAKPGSRAAQQALASPDLFVFIDGDPFSAR